MIEVEVTKQTKCVFSTNTFKALRTASLAADLLEIWLGAALLAIYQCQLTAYEIPLVERQVNARTILAALFWRRSI